MMTYRQFVRTGDSSFTVILQFVYSSVSLVHFENQLANSKFNFIYTLCSQKYRYP